MVVVVVVRNKTMLAAESTIDGGKAVNLIALGFHE